MSVGEPYESNHEHVKRNVSWGTFGIRSWRKVSWETIGMRLWGSIEELLESNYYEMLVEEPLE